MTTNTPNTQTPTLVYFEDVQVGDEIPKLVKSPVTHLQLVRYAGASGDFNPLHTDPKFGEMIGTGGIIAHGMLIMGFVGQLLSDYIGPAALRKFGVRFKGMTRLDDVITCTGVITEKYEADGEARIAGKVQAADQNGDVKVTGTFVAALAKRG
ncbi:MAG TPA: MaoC/PaaZ C-terminal domain-containing protein [Ktedonobacteraceae bacterium]|nr:MaoC/PaaZ C-terminal domain-containing protein [Ktedonobacteraceae bacterium]